MKKLLLILCVFVAFNSYAQDVKFGAKAGLNLSTLVGDDVDDIDMKAGLYFGGFMNVSLSDNLSFQPEFLYSRQGWKADDEGVDYTFKTSYINVPLLLKMSLSSSDKVHIYAGPQLGFLVKSEIKGEKGGDSATTDFKDFTNKFDLSLNLGFSFNVSDNIALDIRYNRGLSKVLDVKEIGDQKAYNSGFQLGLSYSF